MALIISQKRFSRSESSFLTSMRTKNILTSVMTRKNNHCLKLSSPKGKFIIAGIIITRPSAVTHLL